MSVPAGTSRTLYFDAQEAFSLGVTILACGHDYHRRILAPDDRWKMRSHGLVIVLDGAGFFLSESHPHTRFAGGDAFFLFPEEEHAYSPDPGTIMEDYWFRMDGILLASLTK